MIRMGGKQKIPPLKSLPINYIPSMYTTTVGAETRTIKETLWILDYSFTWSDIKTLRKEIILLVCIFVQMFNYIGSSLA